jgi:hypothetical protein
MKPREMERNDENYAAQATGAVDTILLQERENVMLVLCD